MSVVKDNTRKRRGIAAVEFAVVAPLLVLVVFGGIEATHFISLQHSANQISYSVAADLVLTDKSVEELEQQYEQIAVDSGYANASVDITGAPNTIASVVVTIPYAENATLASLFSKSDAIGESFVYRRN